MYLTYRSLKGGVFCLGSYVRLCHLIHILEIRKPDSYEIN